MNQPIGIQRKRDKGWKMPPKTISVTRPGLWGNHHRVGADDCGDALTAVLRYESDLLNMVSRDSKGTPLLHRISELKGWNLACYCKMGDPCHRDILLQYANPVQSTKEQVNV
jgi:hypothetical protein